MDHDWTQLFFPQGVPEQHQAKLEAVRTAFATLGCALSSLLPHGRYKEQVRTHLEDAAAMATKAFTHGHIR